MESAKRIVVNTAAQYARSLINITLSLYSTRLILDALSVSDYGLYSVVGGLVSMLGFITNALIITTQRHISYYYGKGNRDYVRKLFVNSFLLHLIIGLSLAAIMYIPGDWLMDNILNIDDSRILAAKFVYNITIIMLFITIITTPFKALFIAHENIIYISIIEVCDGIAKLFLAFYLLLTTADKLMLYASIMALILLTNLLAYVIYALIHFKECTIIIRRKDVNKECMAKLTGFAGWTTYAMGAIAARNQGTSVILNYFFGTIINAAYGIAFQVYSAVSFVATSVLNAMNPQIMKAAGAGDIKKTFSLAEKESKFSTALMSVVSIPLIMEMPSVLELWLKEVPENTTLFCRFILIGFLFDQATYGLHTVNQALGKIRNYTLLIYTPKLLTLLGIWIMLSNNYEVKSIMYLYIIIELIAAIIRLPYLKYTAGLSITTYIINVIIPLIPLLAVQAITGCLCSMLKLPYGFILSILFMLVTGSLAIWFFTLNDNERNYAKSLINSKRRIPC